FTSRNAKPERIEAVPDVRWCSLMLSAVTDGLTTASTGQCLLSRFVHLAPLAYAQTAPPRPAGQALPVKHALEGPCGRGNKELNGVNEMSHQKIIRYSESNHQSACYDMHGVVYDS
ncbi:hypothetical protein, partial [Alkalispirochaeta sphaeroplastigenens]|uniref:hypothetical protein n=1 Tax=Alkalispirochaeta sphaeroplastigenens TaxID=1187066 RepID=UPI001CA57FDD